MKKIFFVLFILSAISISSLKAQFSVGPGVFYSSNINTIGIDGFAHYAFQNKLGIEAGYSYFFEKDKQTWSAIDADITYDFYSLGDHGSVYGLVGVDFLHSKDTRPLHTDKDWTGVNVGVGWRIGVGSAMSIVPEVEGTFGGANYVRAGIKLMFGLGASK